MARRRARELAFRALFQADRGQADLDEVWNQIRSEAREAMAQDVDDGYEDVLDSQGLNFAERLVHAYRDHRSEVDEDLAERIEGWTFSQMSQTDLNILRIAVTELRYETDIPPRVTLEMAVRLAKRFGGEDSGRFVNGVLASWYREHHSHEMEGVS